MKSRVFFGLFIGVLVLVSIGILTDKNDNDGTVLDSSGERWDMYMKSSSHSFIPNRIEPPLSLVAMVKTGKYTALTNWFEGLYTIDNILVDKNTIIVSQKDVIKAYLLNNLSFTWKYHLTGDYQVFNKGGLAQKDGLLYIGAYSNDNKTAAIMAINNSSRLIVWEQKIDQLYSRLYGPVLNYPPGIGLTISGNKLVITVNGDRKASSNLLVLDAITGKIIWEKRLKGSFPNEALPTINKNEVIVATSSTTSNTETSFIYKYNLDTAEQLFEKEINGIISSYMVAQDDSLYLTSKYESDLKSSIYSLNLTDGSINWVKQWDSVDNISFFDNRLFVTYYGGLMALDSNSGTVKWSVKLGDENFSDFSTPILPLSKIIIGGGKDKVIRVFNSESGKLTQILRFSDYINDVPDKEVNNVVVAGKYIFGTRTDGRIVVLSGRK